MQIVETRFLINEELTSFIHRGVEKLTDGNYSYKCPDDYSVGIKKE